MVQKNRVPSLTFVSMQCKIEQCVLLTLGKYNSTAALYGELGWQPSHVKQSVSEAREWFRFRKMDRTRLTCKVYTYCKTKFGAWHRHWL